MEFTSISEKLARIHRLFPLFVHLHDDFVPKFKLASTAELPFWNAKDLKRYIGRLHQLSVPHHAGDDAFRLKKAYLMGIGAKRVKVETVK